VKKKAAAAAAGQAGFNTMDEAGSAERRRISGRH
jgi:hypothetical protein